MQPISLYIHVPFCTRRCSYCSFYHVPSAHDREASFVDALVDEIAAAVAAIGDDVEFRTVFVGGGTPTVLGEDSWRRVMASLSPHFGASGPVEFTVEANPEDVTASLVRFLKSLGVNRVSLGIQSMHAVGQKVLKRCDPQTNVRAIETVQRVFDNVSFDVLLGVPKTVPADLHETMNRLLEFDPRHLSVYGLEPGGDMSHEVERFFRAVDPDRVADEYLGVCETLETRGYGHYEVSNFARPGFESAHNRVYWDGGDYLGVGPAAHSSIAGERFWNLPSLDAYVGRRAEAHLRDRVRDTGGDGPIERAMLALRTDRGMALDDLAPRAVDELVGEHLAIVDGGRLRLTDRGFLVLNDIVLRLVPGTQRLAC
jgi:putative oxygen-independent coproporphyrinogen III oxidase